MTAIIMTAKYRLFWALLCGVALSVAGLHAEVRTGVLLPDGKEFVSWEEALQFSKTYYEGYNPFGMASIMMDRHYLYPTREELDRHLARRGRSISASTRTAPTAIWRLTWTSTNSR